MMDVEQLEAEAKATAAKHVINMLQRPGQLEKASENFIQESKLFSCDGCDIQSRAII